MKSNCLLTENLKRPVTFLKVCFLGAKRKEFHNNVFFLIVIVLLMFHSQTNFRYTFQTMSRVLQWSVFENGFYLVTIWKGKFNSIISIGGGF